LLPLVFASNTGVGRAMGKPFWCVHMDIGPRLRFLKR
jgi:hypothetical protein